MPRKGIQRRAIALLLMATLAGCSTHLAPTTAPVPPAEGLKVPAIALPGARTLTGLPGGAQEPQDLYNYFEAKLREGQTRDWRHDPAALRWNDIAIDYINPRIDTPVCLSRFLTLLHVAIYDAMVAAEADGASTQDQEAVAAFAAAHVLSYGYPQDRDRFLALALSDIAVTPSNRAQAEALAEAVTHPLIDYARKDGVHQKRDIQLAQIPGLWYDPNPIEPTGGSWRPWVLASNAELIVPEPPEAGSAALAALVADLRVRQAALTPVRKQNAVIWATILPPLDWNRVAALEILDRHLSSLEAARILLWFNMAQADALIACWHNKYKYRLLRPFMADASFTPFLHTQEAQAVYEALPVYHADPDFAPFWETATPRHPSYPAGHSTQSQAAASYLSYVFPDKAELWQGLADASGLSRLDAGLHYTIDHTQGQWIGRTVAKQVIAAQQSNHSFPWRTPLKL